MSQRFCQPKVAPVACSVAAGTRIRSNTFLRSRSSAARAREIRKKTPETSSAARSNDSMRPSTKPVRVSKIWTKKWMKISAQAKIHSRVLCDGECFRREMNIPTRTARIRMVGSLSKREVTILPWESGEFSNFTEEFAIHLWYYSVTLWTKGERDSGFPNRTDFQLHLRAFRQVNFTRRNEGAASIYRGRSEALGVFFGAGRWTDRGRNARTAESAV